MNKFYDDFKLINTHFSSFSSPLQGQFVFQSKKVEIGMTPPPCRLAIFKKKINDKAKTIPLNTPNDLGHIRHFPSTTKEWSSSVYAYNNNNDIKSLPILDKNLVKLIKSFFNFYHQSEKLKLKYKRILLRFRRISLKKIFVSKAELKHTNSKVIINIHVYNLQKKLLNLEIFKMKSLLRSILIKKSIWLQSLHLRKKSFLDSDWHNWYGIVMESMKKEKLLIIKNKKNNKCINKRDIPYFFFLMKERSINVSDFPSILSLIEEIEKEKIYLESLIEKPTQIPPKGRHDVPRYKFIHPPIFLHIPLFHSILKQINTYLNEPKLTKYPELYWNLKVKHLENELELVRYYHNFSVLYHHKFVDLIPKFKEVIEKIYKKKVEFNIVSLKHMYFNSDILSQAIVLKLKDRDNRVWTVLKFCLGMVKLPNSDLLKEKSEAIRGKSLVDKIKNLDIDSITTFPQRSKPLACFAAEASPLKEEGKQDNDSLNKLLYGIIPHPPSSFGDKPTQGFMQTLRPEKNPPSFPSHVGEKDSSSEARPINLSGLPQPDWWYPYYSFFFKNCLKDKVIGGVRLEAKGRLTRRFTASRSVFKLKWKGSLKNIDSSYKGLSAVMLRGHVKSNVQYSVINSKNRNGAYGIKSWVSGK